MNPDVLIGATVKRVRVVDPGIMPGLMGNYSCIIIDFKHPELPDFFLIAPYEISGLFAPLVIVNDNVIVEAYETISSSD